MALTNRKIDDQSNNEVMEELNKEIRDLVTYLSNPGNKRSLVEFLYQHYKKSEADNLERLISSMKNESLRSII